MNWWHAEYKIDGNVKTPTHYLEEVYKHKSDRELADSLSSITGNKVTRNAIKKKRQALGLIKGDTEVANNTIADYVETENSALIETTENKPLTKDDLIRVYQIDTAVWEFDRFKINSWQVGAKDNEGNLVTERLYKTEASLTRKSPLPVYPMIQPMEAQYSFPIQEKESRASAKTALIFADSHFGYSRDLRNAKLTPFQDRSALDALANLARDTQPDRIDILGDILDLPEWSDKFVRSPEFYFTLQPAIVETHCYLAYLRSLCPHSKIVLREGNHDKRLELAILKYLPFAYDLRPAAELNLPAQLTIPSLLNLDALGIEYVSDYPNDVSKLGPIEIMHGDTARSEFNTVSDIAKRCDTSRIVGHIHRREVATHTHWNGKEYYTVEGICPGCTCRIDGAVPGRTKRQQWQNGALLLEYTQNHYSYQMLPIENGKLLYNGLVYKGCNNTNALREAYPDWNW